MQDTKPLNVRPLDGSCRLLRCRIFFFFNDTATTEIYTLSLHDALPICRRGGAGRGALDGLPLGVAPAAHGAPGGERSEEHTSELQSQSNLVCRLLLEKKNEDVATSRATQNSSLPDGQPRLSPPRDPPLH